MSDYMDQFIIFSKNNNLASVECILKVPQSKIRENLSYVEELLGFSLYFMNDQQYYELTEKGKIFAEMMELKSSVAN